MGDWRPLSLSLSLSLSPHSLRSTLERVTCWEISAPRSAGHLAALVGVEGEPDRLERRRGKLLLAQRELPAHLPKRRRGSPPWRYESVPGGASRRTMLSSSSYDTHPLSLASMRRKTPKKPPCLPRCHVMCDVVRALPGGAFR